jgi:hypothetical protein
MSKLKFLFNRTSPFVLIKLIAVFVLFIFITWVGVMASEDETPQVQNAEAQVIEQLNGGSEYTYFPLAIHDNLRAMNVFGVETRLPPDDALGKLIETDTYWVHGIWAHWDAIEPTKGGGYLWSTMANEEERLKIASLNELTPIVTIRRAPSWAQVNPPNQYCGRILPSELDEFASYVSALVTRYSAPPYNVNYWELWNEPDVTPSDAMAGGWQGCWGDSADSAGYGGINYASMLMQVYPAIKAVDPNAKVLIGGLLLDCDPIAYPGFCFASNFLNGILAAGGGPYFDGIGFNSYDYYLDSLGSYSNLNWFSSWNDTGPVIAAKADFLRSVLSSHSVTGKFLIGLESGLLCDTSWGHTCESDFETTKAYYLAKAYAMTIGENVIGNNWYGHEFSFQTATNTRNSALLDINRDPLPAYHTYQFASGFLNGATSDSDSINSPAGSSTAQPRTAIIPGIPT